MVDKHLINSPFETVKLPIQKFHSANRLLSAISGSPIYHYSSIQLAIHLMENDDSVWKLECQDGDIKIHVCKTPVLTSQDRILRLLSWKFILKAPIITVKIAVND